MLQELFKKIRTLGDESTTATAPSLPLAVSALLLEVAYADHHADATDLEEIRGVISDTFALEPAEIETLLVESADYYQASVGAQPLTRAITEAWSEGQRYELLVTLWRVALAQDGISALEEHRIRHLADMLYLSHRRFIEAKFAAKAALENPTKKPTQD